MLYKSELHLMIKCHKLDKDSIVFNLRPYRIFMYRHTYPKRNIFKMLYKVTNICHMNH